MRMEWGTVCFVGVYYYIVAVVALLANDTYYTILYCPMVTAPWVSSRDSFKFKPLT